MQKILYTGNTQQKIRSKFGDKKEIRARMPQRFPMTAEREYLRFTNSYMRELKKILQEELPTLKTEYKRQIKEAESMRNDGIFDLAGFIADFIARIHGKMMGRLNEMEESGSMLKMLRKIGMIAKSTEISEWKKQVRKTLGVDIYEDYYNGDFFASELENWVNDNVGLINTIPENMLGRMQKIILDGYNNGRSTTEITEQIQESYQISKRHARLIARDQMGKLNARINRKLHEDAGVHKYEWSDSGDQRVRESHRRLNGQIFEYSNPPETDDGRHCNPGEDYQCRCVDLAVFDFDTLTLPLVDDEE